MAMRIGGEPTAPEPSPDKPEQTEAASLPTSLSALDAPAGQGMVDPLVARYLGPTERCQTCIHFMEPGSCEVVSGEIDPEGVCSLHTGDEMDDDMDEDEAADVLEAMPEADNVEPIADEEAEL
jgi:hypothetical protein